VASSRDCVSPKTADLAYAAWHVRAEYSLKRRREFLEKYGFPNGAKLVLFMGRFAYPKGVLELAESEVLPQSGNEGTVRSSWWRSPQTEISRRLT
jgi:hypothetical protein